uniref:Uncharacterized protein n=1 Tax=Romanomermis culicivorax TaxID=13658 RepID=A0A915HGB3_ROMCU
MVLARRADWTATSTRSLSFEARMNIIFRHLCDVSNTLFLYLPSSRLMSVTGTEIPLVTAAVTVAAPSIPTATVNAKNRAVAYAAVGALADAETATAVVFPLTGVRFDGVWVNKFFDATAARTCPAAVSGGSRFVAPTTPRTS